MNQEPKVLVRQMAQRYQVSVQEYVTTRSLRDFSEDVMAYYCEVLAPVAAVAEAFGGAEDGKPSGKVEYTDSKTKRSKPSWFQPKPNSRVHNIGKKGEAIPKDATSALRNVTKNLGGWLGSK